MPMKRTRENLLKVFEAAGIHPISDYIYLTKTGTWTEEYVVQSEDTIMKVTVEIYYGRVTKVGKKFVLTEDDPPEILNQRYKNIAKGIWEKWLADRNKLELKFEIPTPLATQTTVNIQGDNVNKKGGALTYNESAGFLSNIELSRLLAERLAKGEISEELYRKLRKEQGL